MRFPYLHRGRHTYPIVPVTLSHQDRVLRTEGLLDSGANISLFSAEIADYLGLPLETGRLTYLSGIGGRIIGYEHVVGLQVETTRIEANIVFSVEFTASFNILGRDNFFEHFRITFNERLQSVDLEIEDSAA